MQHVTIKTRQKKIADGREQNFLCLLEQYFLVLCYSLTPPVLHWRFGLGVTSPSVLFPAWHNHTFTLKLFKAMSAHTSYNPCTQAPATPSSCFQKQKIPHAASSAPCQSVLCSLKPLSPTPNNGIFLIHSS